MWNLTLYLANKKNKIYEQELIMSQESTTIRWKTDGFFHTKNKDFGLAKGL